MITFTMKHIKLRAIFYFVLKNFEFVLASININLLSGAGTIFGQRWGQKI